MFLFAFNHNANMCSNALMHITGVVLVASGEGLHDISQSLVFSRVNSTGLLVPSRTFTGKAASCAKLHGVRTFCVLQFIRIEYQIIKYRLFIKKVFHGSSFVYPATSKGPSHKKLRLAHGSHLVRPFERSNFSFGLGNSAICYVRLYQIGSHFTVCDQFAHLLLVLLLFSSLNLR